MQYFWTIFLTALSSSTVSSHAIGRRGGNSSRTCVDYSIPVNVNSTVLTPGFPPFVDNFDVANFVARLTSRSVDTSLIVGTEKVTATYNIGATICIPTGSNSHQKTLLVASHGLGYDRRYWDSGIDPESYSFVDFAISKGYPVFFYDRLGTGESSKVSGYNQSQATTQLSILASLTQLLRSGHYTSSLGTPSKIVHIGHSFGSVLSSALVTDYLALSDGAILTGYGFDFVDNSALLESFALRSAKDQAPGKWPGRDESYLTWVDKFANLAVFFHGNSYSREVLQYTEDVKQPLGAIELISAGSIAVKTSTFQGTLMVISGEYDFAVCGGNCTGTLAGPAAAISPNATDLTTVVHPESGHAINFSYNATGAYGVITDYLTEHGL